MRFYWSLFALLFLCALCMPGAEEKAENNPRQEENLRFRDWYDALPEQDRKQLEELRAKDPDKYRQALRERMPEALRQRFDEREALRKLGESYREAKTKEEKDRIEAELRERLKEHYAEALERNRKRLDHAQADLKELEDEYKQRSAKADEIVESELQRLLEPSQDDAESPAN